jgi:hypothetical protein
MSKEALCSICNKPKARDNRSNRCRSCAASAKKDTTGVDCIVVRHSAGNKKGSQKVYKYKATCKTCGKDRGYVFKSALNNNCPSCARKLSTKKTINNNDNGLKMFVDTPLQGQLQVRSSYEFFYCNYLNSKSIKYLYEPTKFKLSDNTTYTPDFYLLEEDKYIELKGKETPEFSRKFELFKKEYSQVSLEMLKHADLKKLGYNAGLFKNRFNVTILGSRWTVFLLTPKEYKLLNTLITFQGEAINRRRLIDHAWGPEFVEANNELNVHIRYLRRKIDDAKNKPLIHTVRGVGFILKD